MRRRVFLCLLAPVFAVLFGTGFVVGSAHAGHVTQGHALMACWHNDVSEWACPDTSLALSAIPTVGAEMTVLPTLASSSVGTMLPPGEIMDGSLTVHTRTKGSVTYRLDQPFDAVFLTKRSMTKVLRGYYLHTLSFKKARAISKRVGQMP